MTGGVVEHSLYQTVQPPNAILTVSTRVVLVLTMEPALGRSLRRNVCAMNA